MIVYEAPNSAPKSIFLAGGITGCPDWQTEVIDAVKNENVMLFNPRRVNFDVEDPNGAFTQIAWEYEHLKMADAILFWFPKEAVQPIALFELGRWSADKKPILVGTHPEYPRRFDVQTQMDLVNQAVYSDLASLVHVIKTGWPYT